MSAPKPWYVYILRSCSGKWLYTGITTDPDRRLREHNHTNRGARFTRQDRPWVRCYLEGPISRNDAIKRELCIKRLGRASKEAIIKRASNA